MRSNLTLAFLLFLLPLLALLAAEGCSPALSPLPPPGLATPTPRH
jgi:hypothetical protein